MSPRVHALFVAKVQAMVTLQDRGRGLRRHRSFQAYDLNGNRLGQPQATRRLARAWALNNWLGK